MAKMFKILCTIFMVKIMNIFRREFGREFGLFCIIWGNIDGYPAPSSLNKANYRKIKERNNRYRRYKGM